jgi:hypothetical protein
VLVAEVLKTVTESSDDFWLCADDDSEETLLKEALAWEGQAVLVGQ